MGVVVPLSKYVFCGDPSAAQRLAHEFFMVALKGVLGYELVRLCGGDFV